MSSTEGEGRPPSFREGVRAWLRVALHSFGGPAGQIAVLHRVVVDEKRWLDEAGFLRALSFCMLLPGPEAQQLTTYVGWRLHGVRGGLVAGWLFILPGFVSILALSIVYVLYGDASMVTGLFYGLKPAVLAIVLHAVWRLRRRALTRRGDILIAGGAFVALFFLRVPFPLVILAALAIGALRPTAGAETARGADRLSFRHGVRTAALWLALWLVPVAALRLLLGPENVLTREALFFSQAAVVTFGGAYSALAYVAQQAVDAFGWLSPGEMLDGLGLAETTPGPLIQVVQFVGFMGAYRNPGALPPLTAGVLGSLVTTWVTFAPCFFFIFVGAPLIERLDSPRLQAALAAITAAVTGVVLNLAVWFALHVLFADVRRVGWGPFAPDLPVPGTLDPGSLVIAILAVFATFRLGAGMFATLGGGAVLGWLLWVL